MLKRAFLGGLLSAGVNVIDYKDLLTAVLRHSLFIHDNYTAGVYFCQKLEDASSTVLTFYNHEALRINNDISKKIEKAFSKMHFS